MKTFYLTLFFLTAFISVICQEIFISSDTTFERQTYNWYYTDIIIVDTALSKEILFQKARQWFSESFVSAQAVIDNEDKSEGVIYGKGNIPMAKNVDGRVKFTIEIRCKDGKVKYIFSNFIHDGACVISLSGTCSTPYKEFGLGTLTQSENPLSYSKTGRSKEKFWNSIRNQAKLAVYNSVKSIHKTFDKNAIKEKDSW